MSANGVELLFVLLHMLLICHGLLDSGLGSDDENNLVKFLFEQQGYNSLIRPVRNLTEIVFVDFNLALIQLIGIDEKNQVMKSNVWLRMMWEDYQLHWDPADYGGITVIRVTADKVWKPDIVLFNNADGKYEVSYMPNVVIYNNGKVLWIPPSIYQSSCTIDVEYFPFDEQNCEMKFGSWTFNGDQVRLSWYEGKEKVDLSDYVNSNSWDIIECPGNETYFWDSIENHHKSWITYKVRIRRKTLFYTMHLILPCVLISFLSVTVFCLPADAGEKMTLSISILIALVFFLLLVSKILPATSVTIPLLSKYLLFTFIMNVITIVVIVITINWNFRSPRTHRMSYWVRIIFLNYLPRVVLMKRLNHNDRWQKKRYCRRQDLMHARQSISKRSTTRLDENFCNNIQAYHLTSTSDTFSTERDCRNNGYSLEAELKMTPEIQKSIDAVNFIATHLKNEDDYQEILDDWRYVAAVIDRFQLCIFVTITIGGTIGILINAPHIFEHVDQDKVLQAIVGSRDGRIHF